jgi:hypothetical protein
MIAPSRRLGSRRLYCSTRSVAALAAARFTELHLPALSQVSDRYLQDTFYGGGRWPLLAAFLGLAYLRLGRAASMPWPDADTQRQLPAPLTRGVSRTVR